jgi:hypothetical protein
MLFPVIEDLFAVEEDSGIKMPRPLALPIALPRIVTLPVPAEIDIPSAFPGVKEVAAPIAPN